MESFCFEMEEGKVIFNRRWYIMSLGRAFVAYILCNRVE